MPTLTPVEHDPFGSPQFGFTPVDHDPWASDPSPSDIQSMTHQPEGQNPAASYLDTAKRVATKGLAFATGGLKGAGVDVLPDWMNAVGGIVQNPDNQAAMGAVSWAPRAAQLFNSGLSYSQIAERLGTSRGGVAGALRDLRSAGQMEPAAATPAAFSDPQLWQRAKDLRAQGASDADIVRQLKVSPSWVSNAFRRGGGTDMTPGLPALRFMRGETVMPDLEYEKALHEYLKSGGMLTPVDHDPFVQ